jgi:hypothetical protein
MKRSCSERIEIRPNFSQQSKPFGGYQRTDYST